MTKEELAALLNGREYGNEITDAEAKAAHAAGLVVVFGGSDDLIYFAGAASDERTAYDRDEFHFTAAGFLLNDCDDDRCPHFERLAADAAVVESRWCAEGNNGPAWSYETKIPHATFDILEEAAPYCRGIVFALADLKQEEHRDTAIQGWLDLVVREYGEQVAQDCERVLIRGGYRGSVLLVAAKNCAEQDRSYGIQQIQEDYRYTIGPCTHMLSRDQAERLYDIGYRRNAFPFLFGIDWSQDVMEQNRELLAIVREFVQYHDVNDESLRSTDTYFDIVRRARVAASKANTAASQPS